MKIKKIPFVAFLIPFLILLLGFRFVVFDTNFYKTELEKYNIYDKFDKEIADSAVENLISYMKSGIPLSDFFNEKEKLHMLDVRNIVQKLLFFMYVLLFAVLLLLFKNRKSFFSSLFYGGVITLILLFLFFIFSYTSFDFIFHKFHEFSFSNNFWQLNPKTDNLQALMPDGFFYDALIRIFTISLVISLALIFIGAIKSFKYLKNFSK